MAANSRFAVATHILTGLGMTEGGRMSSDLIARSVNTNPVVIRRILGDLRRAGLVVAQTGKAGGAQLARAPKDISLHEIFQAVEGGALFAFNPNAAVQKCPVSSRMRALLEPVFLSADQAVADQLKRVRLSELVGTVKRECRGNRK